MKFAGDPGRQKKNQTALLGKQVVVTSDSHDNMHIVN